MANIRALEQSIGINKDDYISLTDIAKYKECSKANEIIRNWLRNHNTIDFLGIWGHLYNPDFKPVEFDRFKKEARRSLNNYTTILYF